MLPASVSAPEIQRGAVAGRIVLTLAILAVYRLFEWLPLPGIELRQFAAHGLGGTGAPLARLSAFALGVVPLLSALLLAELGRLAFPDLVEWERRAEENRETVSRAILILSLVLAAVQAFGLSIALENVPRLVPEPGVAFRVGCVASLVAATAFIAWLSSVVTRYGVGSGFWILAITPALSSLAHTLVAGFGQPDLPNLLIPTLALIAAATLALAVLTLREPRLLTSGQLLWPPLLAYMTLGLVYTPLVPFVSKETMDGLLGTLAPGHPVRLALLAGLIALFYVMRQQAQGLFSGKERSGVPPLLPIAALFFIVAAADLTTSALPLPGVFDGRSLIIIVVVALSIVAGMRSASKAEATPSSNNNP